MIFYYFLLVFYLCFFLGFCVVGVVGFKKFCFDIFGELVDIIRQMEEIGIGIVMLIIFVFYNNMCDLLLKC